MKLPCLAKIVNKRIDGSIYIFQEILQTGKESALFTIHYYNKNIDTEQQRKQLSAI